jgi:hypothetical protein
MMHDFTGPDNSLTASPPHFVRCSGDGVLRNAQSNRAATSHTWLLGTWNVSSLNLRQAINSSKIYIGFQNVPKKKVKHFLNNFILIVCLNVHTLDILGEIKNIKVNVICFFWPYLFIYFVFWPRVPLCSAGWPQTHDPSASASPVLGFEACKKPALLFFLTF